MTPGIFRIIFPKSMILNKIRNFVNPGNDSGEFPENFSRHILLQLFSNFSDFIFNQGRKFRFSKGFSCISLWRKKQFSFVSGNERLKLPPRKVRRSRKVSSDFPTTELLKGIYGIYHEKLCLVD